MTFERTHDLKLIREVMTHPKVYPWITDAGSPSAADFQPSDHPSIWYMLAFDGEELLGLWMFVPENCVCWAVHTCLLPGHGLHRARQAAQEMAAWIWANTGCQRIVTSVPVFNRQALNFAKAAGMAEYGRNERSFLVGGKLWDQVMLGISKET